MGSLLEGRERSRIGKRKTLDCDGQSPQSLTIQSSEVVVAYQHCPTLRWGGWAFTSLRQPGIEVVCPRNWAWHCICQGNSQRGLAGYWVLSAYRHIRDSGRKEVLHFFRAVWVAHHSINYRWIIVFTCGPLKFLACYWNIIRGNTSKIGGWCSRPLIVECYSSKQCDHLLEVLEDICLNPPFFPATRAWRTQFTYSTLLTR